MSVRQTSLKIIVIIYFGEAQETSKSIVVGANPEASKLYPAEWTPVFWGFPGLRTVFLG